MKRSICGLIVQDLSRPNLVELVMYDHCDHLIVFLSCIIWMKMMNGQSGIGSKKK